MSGPTQPDPLNWAEALDWLARADEDLRLAEKIVSDGEFTASAAFHSQQAAEKMAKAILISFGANYPRIHDIAELATLIEATRPELGRLVGRLSGVTGWYLGARYPRLEYQASQEDIRGALEVLNELRRQIYALTPKTGDD
jgi:HEPN domain-containing protein